MKKTGSQQPHKLVINLETELYQALKGIASRDYRTLRAVILLALVRQYPELEDIVGDIINY